MEVGRQIAQQDLVDDRGQVVDRLVRAGGITGADRERLLRDVHEVADAKLDVVGDPSGPADSDGVNECGQVLVVRAVDVGDTAADREPQPGTAVHARRRSVDLAEHFEQPVPSLHGNADARVTDRKRRYPARAVQ